MLPVPFSAVLLSLCSGRLLPRGAGVWWCQSRDTGDMEHRQCQEPNSTPVPMQGWQGHGESSPDPALPWEQHPPPQPQDLETTSPQWLCVGTLELEGTAGEALPALLSLVQLWPGELLGMVTLVAMPAEQRGHLGPSCVPGRQHCHHGWAVLAAAVIYEIN